MFMFFRKYKYFLFFLVLFSLLLVATKYYVIKFSQEYLSQYLEKKVSLQAFYFYPPQVQFSIQKKENLLTINLQKLLPLTLKASYNGELEAFDTLQPLKEKTQIQAKIVYTNTLFVEADSTLYNSQTHLKLNNKDNIWHINIDTKHLNIDQFKQKNNYDFPLFGDLTSTATLHYHNDDNNISKLKFTLHPQSLKIASYHIKEPLTIHGNLTYKDFLQLKIKTKKFGSDIFFTLNDENVSLKANKLNMQELLSFLKEKAYVQGDINLFAKGDFKKLSFKLTSKAITPNKELISLKQAIKADVSGTYNITKKQLTSNFKLFSAFKDEKIQIDGKLNYKEKLFIQASTNSFDAKTKFHLYNKHFTLVSKKLNSSKVLTFLGQKAYVKGLANLKADGDFEKINFTLNANKLLIAEAKQKAHLKFHGQYNRVKKSFRSTYRIDFPIKNKHLSMYGKLLYKDSLYIDAKSTLFDSKTSLSLKKNKILLDIKHLNLFYFSSLFMPKNKIYGNLDLQAKGTLKALQIHLSSNNFHKKNLPFGLNHKTNIDLDINYTPKLVKFVPHISNKEFTLQSGIALYKPQSSTLQMKHKIILNYKEQKLPVKVSLVTTLKPPYHTSGEILHKKDHVIVKTFSYEDGVIKSDFDIDIKELSLYKTLSYKELYGPLKVQAHYKDNFELSTQNFGGNLKLTMKNNLIKVDIKELNLVKIMHLIGKDLIVNKGDVNGLLKYDLKRNSAKTQLKITDAILNGIDLDKYLSRLQNTMGLNIFLLTKNALKNIQDTKVKTDIKHLQCDVILKNKNIHLKDVAFKTKKFRIAALGDIDQNGTIQQLHLHILNKKGCSFLEQAFEGNIKDPKLSSTTSTAINILESTPTSLLTTGKKIINFGANTVDSTASFALHTTHLSDRNISLTRKTIDKGNSVIQGTKSYIPLKNFKECKVIYRGKVKDTF